MFEVGKVYNTAVIQDFVFNKQTGPSKQDAMVINQGKNKFSILTTDKSGQKTMYQFERHPGYNQFKCIGIRGDIL